MDDQKRATLLDDIAADAGRKRDAFLDDAGRRFAGFIDANKYHLKDLGGLVLIDDDSEYLSVTEEGTFRSRTRFQEESGEWVSETEEIKNAADLVEVYNPADLYAAFADAARDEAELDETEPDDELPAEADLTPDEKGEEEAEPEEAAPALDDDWVNDIPTPRDKPHAARLLYDLALTFQERSQLDQAQLLDDFQDVSAGVAGMLGDSKVIEDEDERLWFRASGAFGGEVLPEQDGGEDGGEAGEPEWLPLTTPDDMVQFYDPTDLFGDLAEAVADTYPEVAPELDEGDEGEAPAGDTDGGSDEA
ncbi:MAG: hypothetical protein U9O18_09145 [Chloroflexota bacterium]|nr:hypothetical protein [Chloroflexota bacterium]